MGDPEETPELQPTLEAFIPILSSAFEALVGHWLETSSTTAVDSVHEGTFTFVLYALRCVRELLGANRLRISGRMLLRTLTECRITLAYLQIKNDQKLWERFRHYGAGQAKLALLKISEAKRPPHSVSVELLERLANEDMWQEFVDIDLGHWAGEDLRKMAEVSGTKHVYDAHYGWTSGFVHGQWSAMRDAALTICLNPLHRVHRVPLLYTRQHGDTFADAVDLVESMIQGLLQKYPGPQITLRPKEDLESAPAL